MLYGSLDINAESLKVNGYRVASFAGTLSADPPNPRPGLMYYDSVNDKVRLYVEDAAIGVGQWVEWSVA
jgi:hypothetical protein